MRAAGGRRTRRNRGAVVMPLAARGLLERGEATRSAHGMVTQAIGMDILSGRFPSGEVLPGEDELLQRFGVSRTALREALKTLAAKGMIVPKARVGTRVLPQNHWHMFDPDLIAWRLQAGMDSDFMRHFFEIRFAIEPAAAALACIRRTDAELKALAMILDDMARQSGDLDRFVAVDLIFHKTILAASGNPMMLSIGAVIEAALLTVFRRSAPTDNPDRHAAIVAKHRRIYEAIAARDQAGASASMIAVIREGAAHGGLEEQ
jgi:DNA-binding FadR family transcriptional regulator